MRRTEIHLSEPFEELLASVLRLPSTLAQIDELQFEGAADSQLRKSAKCDAEVKEALRSLYEAAHGRQVETQIGFVTIAPPVAGFLKEAPYCVTTQYEFFLEAFTRALAGASTRKTRTNGGGRHAANSSRKPAVSAERSKKGVTSTMKFKTYTVHAWKEEPQYLIKSEKTDHMAMHKGTALKKLSQKKPVSQR